MRRGDLEVLPFAHHCAPADGNRAVPSRLTAGVLTAGCAATGGPGHAASAGRLAGRLVMEGGPMQVKQTVEAIKLCAAAKDARQGLPLQFAGN